MKCNVCGHTHDRGFTLTLTSHGSFTTHHEEYDRIYNVCAGCRIIIRGIFNRLGIISKTFHKAKSVMIEYDNGEKQKMECDC